jgi:hypothetical protein
MSTQSMRHGFPERFDSIRLNFSTEKLIYICY